MQILPHEFTDKKISPWGGMKLVYQAYRNSKLKEFLTDLDLPEPGSNRAHDSVEIIEGFLTSVITGAKRFQHTSVLRHDEVIAKIFNWEKGMASPSTFCRFFKKFDTERNQKVFIPLLRHMMRLVPIRYMTIDLDSSVITRYGNQEAVAVGYNPKKQGRASHHPIMAFCAELKMVVNARMRKGNSDSKTDILPFLEEIFSIVPRENIGLIRGDVGFYSDKIMDRLEKEGVNYLFKARMGASFLNRAVQTTDWHHSDEVVKNACYSEFEYNSTGHWKRKRRMIIVGIPRNNKNIKYPELFEEYEILQQMEFSVYVTNSKLSAVQVHKQYNARGECENRIKELKYDFGIDGFVMKSFAATDAAFRLVMVAFNLITILKQGMLQLKVNHRLSTLKFQCIAIGSYIATSGRKHKLKLAAEGRRRQFLEHIFDKVEKFTPPFKFSNA